MLAGAEAPPLDLKPRHKPRGNLPPKPKNQPRPESKPLQAQNRPAPGGGANKKQRLETLLATEHLHGHCFAWPHTNPNNHSLKCSTCSLFIQQVHPPEIFSRLEAQPCAHRPVPDLGKFQLHQSHSFYNMGAVLLCTKCFAVHKPGQLTPFKVVKEPCEGASRAHARRRAYWAQRYLHETTAPANLFEGNGGKPALEASRAAPTLPGSPTHPPAAGSDYQSHANSTGSGPHTLTAVAKADQSSLDTTSQEKTERSQGSSPATLGVPPPPVARTPPQTTAQVSLEAPVPKPVSGQGCSASSCFGPVPKPQPKAKNRKEPDPSSQPKLAQFFVAQTRKANACSNTSQDGPTAPAQVSPKSLPTSPFPANPLPAQVATSLGSRSHGGGGQEGKRKRDRKGRK